MYQILLIDKDPRHAESLVRQLALRSLHVSLVPEAMQAEAALRRPDAAYDLVIMNVSDPARPWVTVLEQLQQAHRAALRAWPPLILCVSTRQREPQFELEIERKGARYVYEP